MKIKTISARWDCKGDKSETYRLLNMIHAMTGDSDDFCLKETCTDSDYVLTTWTNGIVDIKAESYKDYDGTPVLHVYTLTEAKP